MIKTVVVVVSSLLLSVDVAARVFVCASISSPLTERERRDSMTIAEDSDGSLFVPVPPAGSECSQSDR